MSAPSFALELGSRGKFVRALQVALNARKPAGTLPIATDGIMGPATIARAALVLGRPGAKTFDRAALASAGVNVVLLADLSGHNEGGNKRAVDVDRMAAAGCHGVWFKLSEGTTYTNREAVRQSRDAVRTLLRGGYHFGDPSTDRTAFDVVALEADARAEANHYLRQRAITFGLHLPELPDLLDLERGVSQRTGKRLAALVWPSARKHEAAALWALAWLNVVEQSTRRKPWIYLPKWAFGSFFSRAPSHLIAALQTYRNVVASYNGGAGPDRIPPGWEDFGAWQFTGHGSIDGVDGDCDLSWAIMEDLNVV